MHCTWYCTYIGHYTDAAVSIFDGVSIGRLKFKFQETVHSSSTAVGDILNDMIIFELKYTESNWRCWILKLCVVIK